MPKTIAVFGATGLQGGSVIRAIQEDAQLSRQFKIRGITRNIEQPSARALVDTGVEIVPANQDDTDSLLAAVKGADTVFLVTSFENSFSFDIEVQQGKNVVDACCAEGVQHLIFSSLINITEASNGAYTKVYHFDSKAAIEQYIGTTDLPATFVLAGSYMQNFFGHIGKGDNGQYALTLPTKELVTFPLIDIAKDYGKFVRTAMKHRDMWLGKRIYAAQEYYTAPKMIEEYSRVLGRRARVNAVSPAEFMSLMPPEMAEDLAEMAQAYAAPGYFAGASLSGSKAKLEGELTTWEGFLQCNRAAFS